MAHAQQARRIVCLGILGALLAVSPALLAQEIEFVEATESVLNVDPALVADDLQEKDYAWGDVDKDGDIDLVVVRKEPFTTFGKYPNVLLINEDGVLTDRTAEFASASDVPGDNGFLTPTNDRDVVLTDVDRDGWLDIVTAPTLSGSDPKHIGHPRVYMNQRCSGACASTQDWRGFVHEDARIPQMLAWDGQEGGNPRFCAVEAGDVTGDGYVDLHFTDYDSSVLGEMPGPDFNDKLLINLGVQAPGVFVDLTTVRISGLVPGVLVPFEVSNFGTSNSIVDLNGDGLADIVKLSALVEPYYVGVSFNDPDTPGFFDTHDVVHQGAPYFVSTGDLNNDGWPEVIVTEDGADRFYVNPQTGDETATDFISYTFSFEHAGIGSPSADDGFGGNSLAVDLNNDGWNEVLIADVDVDVPGCDRRMHIYKNLAGTPGAVPTLEEQTSGSGCANASGNPPTCIVAGIPSDKLEGVHDVAVFDIDGDGWNDMVVGRCSGSEVYLNQPPFGLAFHYPEGLPGLVDAGAAETVPVRLNGIGGATHVPGTVSMFARVAGGAFTEMPVVQLQAGLYEATLPAAVDCAALIEFYFTAEEIGGGTFTDPPDAPTESYRATVAQGQEVSFSEDVEGDVSSWSIVVDPSLGGGKWAQAQPNGTLAGDGSQAAPSEDAEPALTATHAFVTENLEIPDGPVGEADVDGGPTDLISPPLDLAGTDAIISYSRWFYTSLGTDVLEVSVSNNGMDWQVVENVSGDNNSWQASSFRVGDFVTPSSNVQVRFRADDSPNDSITEAAIDLFQVVRFVCNPQGTGAAGRIPDGDELPGEPLRLNRVPGGTISLSWGSSCNGSDVDYGVYEGSIGSFASHTAVLCSTGGATSTELTPAQGSTYYLVVPNNDINEGSYGADSNASQRSQGSNACFPQEFDGCN